MVDKILQYTAVVADTLQEVANTSQIPFLNSVCTLVLTIVLIFQGMKSQKDRCLSMMERIHQLLCTLTSLSIYSDEIRSPRMLDRIAQFSLCEVELQATFQFFTIGGRDSLNASSGSLSLLPAHPKIFHSRESELKDLIDSLLCDPVCVAILGPGRIGKTTLAMAALHHPAIMEKYNLKHFISCESASTCDDLVAKSRAQIEEFTSLLADIPSIALLVLRLQFADEPGDGEKLALNDLLELSDSLPLAVSLMANIAAFEGNSTTLARWQTENTTLLSEGHDRRSNLKKSITLSLNCPRLSSSPDARNLISLLSLLLDGIRPEDIIGGNVPIPNVRQCQPLFVGTSLAYIDIRGHLKTLSPVRDYIRRAYPPSHSLSRPLWVYFQDLLEVWRSKCELSSGALAPELVAHLGNINQLILEGLRTEAKSTCIELGKSIITLDFFSVTMLKGKSPLSQRLPELIRETGDAGLRWTYADKTLGNGDYDLIQDPNGLVEDGIQYFNGASHLIDEAVNLYNAVARHFMTRKYNNIPRAVEVNKCAFTLAEQADDVELQLNVLETELYMANRCDNPDWLIEVVRKGRDIAGMKAGPTYGWEIYPTPLTLACR
ncbi:hypothetical protein B0H14DRAFT_2607578 [Mycena olivaceomarginata]|nr:hypothetical protein B0H14DRAFT_2607578 [Mycena olivaceomarginata]